jgi:hypothetical protein
MYDRLPFSTELQTYVEISTDHPPWSLRFQYLTWKTRLCWLCFAVYGPFLTKQRLELTAVMFAETGKLDHLLMNPTFQFPKPMTHLHWNQPGIFGPW